MEENEANNAIHKRLNNQSRKDVKLESVLDDNFIPPPPPADFIDEPVESDEDKMDETNIPDIKKKKKVTFEDEKESPVQEKKVGEKMIANFLLSLSKKPSKPMKISSLGKKCESQKSLEHRFTRKHKCITVDEVSETSSNKLKKTISQDKMFTKSTTTKNTMVTSERSKSYSRKKLSTQTKIESNVLKSKQSKEDVITIDLDSDFDYKDRKKEKTRHFVYVGVPRPTLIIHNDSNALLDANSLYNALNRPDPTGKLTIINILAHRNSFQRSQIMNTYSLSYKRDLNSDILSKFPDPFSKCLSSLLYSGYALECYYIRRTLKSTKNDDSILRELLCSNSSSNIKAIKEIYKKMYGKSLEDYIKNNYSGNYRKLLLAICTVVREEVRELTPREVLADLDVILSVNPTIDKSPPESWIEIFSKRSFVQLGNMFTMFYWKNKFTFYHFMKKFSIGHYEKAFMNIYTYTSNPMHFYSKVIRRGLENKSLSQVSRIICSRHEIDLGSILHIYQLRYKKTAHSDIMSTLAGRCPDTTSTLAALMGYQ